MFCSGASFLKAAAHKKLKSTGVKCTVCTLLSPQRWYLQKKNYMWKSVRIRIISHERSAVVLNIITGVMPFSAEGHHSSDSIQSNSTTSSVVLLLYNSYTNSIQLTVMNKNRLQLVCQFNHLFCSISTNSSVAGLVQDCC